MKNTLRRILVTTTGHQYSLADCEKVSYDATDFTATTVHRMPLANGGFIFLQGDKIASIEVWETWFFGLFRKK